MEEAADSKWLRHLLEQPTLANLAIVPVCIVLQALVFLMLASQSILVCVTLMLNVLYRFDKRSKSNCSQKVKSGLAYIPLRAFTGGVRHTASNRRDEVKQVH